MTDLERTQLETTFKEEIKKSLNTEKLYPFPSSLEVQPSNTPDLDRWRKEK